MSDDVRIQNLESNYGRMADSLRRIAEKIEKLFETTEKMSRTMIGHMDNGSNMFVPGYIQRLETVEGTIKSRKKKFFSVLSAAKDIFVGVAVVWIIWKFGISK